MPTITTYEYCPFMLEGYGKLQNKNCSPTANLDSSPDYELNIRNKKSIKNSRIYYLDKRNYLNKANRTLTYAIETQAIKMYVNAEFYEKVLIRGVKSPGSRALMGVGTRLGIVEFHEQLRDCCKLQVK